MLAMMQIAMGQNREALKNLQRSVRLRDPSRQKPTGFRFSNDPGLSTLCSMIWVLSSLGLHDQAARVRQLMRTELPDHKLPGTIALYMQLALGLPALLYGDFEAAERYAAEHVAFCVERKVEQFRLWGGNYQASARAMREPTEENVAASFTTLIPPCYRASSRTSSAATSSFCPLATTRNASSGKARWSFNASGAEADIHISISSGLVRMTGMAFA